MFELNEDQANMLQEMLGDNPYQVIARRPKEKSDEQEKKFAKINSDVDAIVAAGFAQEVTYAINQPKSFTDDFRVIGITVLGKTLFDTGKAAQA